MLSPPQIKQLAELVNEAGIDVKNIDAVNEYIGLLLENISGYECVTFEELKTVQQDVSTILNK